MFIVVFMNLPILAAIAKISVYSQKYAKIRSHEQQFTNDKSPLSLQQYYSFFT